MYKEALHDGFALICAKLTKRPGSTGGDGREMEGQVGETLGRVEDTSVGE